MNKRLSYNNYVNDNYQNIIIKLMGLINLRINYFNFFKKKYYRKKFISILIKVILKNK